MILVNSRYDCKSTDFRFLWNFAINFLVQIDFVVFNTHQHLITWIYFVTYQFCISTSSIFLFHFPLFQEMLTDLEKHLASQMKLLRLPGKQGKGIPVLLDVASQKLMQCLLNDEDLHSNKFLFQSGHRRPYQSHNRLNQLTKEVPQLEKPDVLRATAMRKYCATALQMMELPKY